MKSKETLKFISNNIKGCKTKIALLSISQILLGALTVTFSFMLRFVIGAIENLFYIPSLLVQLLYFSYFYKSSTASITK